MTITNDQLFNALPTTLRKELLDAYQKILNNYTEHRWEPSELNGGKLCEIVYTILKGHVESNYPANASKPRNMIDACKSLEQAQNTTPRSVKIQIPRLLISLYEIRNNRGVGHVGGDVNPNYMDATCVVAMSKWIMAELIRIYHNVNTEEATEVVNSIVERNIPLVWEVNGRKRVLDPELPMLEKTLVLLYTSTLAISEDQLVEWLEHSNASVFRRDILVKAHKKCLLDYDKESRQVHISPIGVKFVEEKILSSYLTG